MVDRSSAPAWVKRSGRWVVRTGGQYTAAARMLPGALLVGGQRCGTTSLHRALLAHPLVVGPTFHKGVNYFDLNYHRGWSWYRGHFPLRTTGQRVARRWKAHVDSPAALAIESSGYYLYHPLALPRIVHDLPRARIVVMLRDPVERAYSAFKHEVARGFESESFERALDLEADRLAGEAERLRTEPRYESRSHRHHAYVERGQYVDQLRTIFALFPREQVHVVDAEDFFATPAKAYAELVEFLGLPAWQPPSFDQHNARPGADLPHTVRERLSAHFRPYDDELEKLLARPLAWRR